jgi:hypothetical protein
MKRLVVRPHFEGPTILELGFLLDEPRSSFEVRWTNSREEVSLIEKYPHHSWTLCVEDLQVMERTASMLGIDPVPGMDDIKTAVLSLLRRTSNWRSFTGRLGNAASRSIVTHIAAQSLRKGENNRFLRRFAQECGLNGVSPIDVDALTRLRQGFRP